MGKARVVVLTGALAGASLIGIPLQWLALRASPAAAARIPHLYHRLVNRLLGVRRTVHGDLAAERPLLLVCNHVSWLDITVLSAVAPVSFVAKSEVARWPVFGLFAKLQRSIFVDRQRRTATAGVTAEMAARLSAGDAVVLFAEGTSSNGGRVLPFRSALLGAVREALAGSEAVWVQPVAIRYRGSNGLPYGRSDAPRLAWYGDMDMLPHLRGMLADERPDAEIRFGAPVAVSADTNRKTLTRDLESAVRALFHARG